MKTGENREEITKSRNRVGEEISDFGQDIYRCKTVKFLKHQVELRSEVIPSNVVIFLNRSSVINV